ncbi:MAG: OmpA family protein [Saprospiraceae bacterium]|nr:OmpA family protein [Saprospiraceae bacterium]
MINSDAYDEISPVVSWDGSKLFFTRVACPIYNRYLLVNGRDISAAPPEKFNAHISKIYTEIAGYQVSNPALSEFNQDVWVAYNENGKFSRVDHPGAPLNNALPNSVCTPTPDHDAYVVINQFKENGGMDKGFSIVRQISDVAWSFPEPLHIEGYETRSEGVNLNMSADGEILILSVDRIEGYGANDLFVSFKTGKNEYSKPVNLGPMINTSFKEITPFLSVDKRIIFFASNRLGNNDIFWAERLDDSWQKWTMPKRFIEPINSPYDDSQPFFHPLSGYMYFTSKRAGTSDIYRIQIQEPQTDEVIVRGKIINSANNKKTSGLVYLGKPNKKKYDTSFDSYVGEFSYHIKPGESIKAQVIKDGFLSQVSTVKIPKDYKEPFYDLVLFVDPIMQGGKISMDPIFFEKSKPDILSSSTGALESLLTTLRLHKGLNIIIEGHTDNQGPANLLEKLSRERAEEVKLYLTERGISSHRIDVKGFGGSRPLNDNSSEALRAQNRRVEIRITQVVDLVEGK